MSNYLLKKKLFRGEFVWSDQHLFNREVCLPNPETLIFPPFLSQSLPDSSSQSVCPEEGWRYWNWRKQSGEDVTHIMQHLRRMFLLLLLLLPVFVGFVVDTIDNACAFVIEEFPWWKVLLGVFSFRTRYRQWKIL